MKLNALVSNIELDNTGSCIDMQTHTTVAAHVTSNRATVAVFVRI